MAVETVITRLYFIKRNSCTERMSLLEFRHSPFLSLLTSLESTPDINSVSASLYLYVIKSRSIFSYKHFYVIYCKFWELDFDHDMYIEPADMYQYSGSSITRSVVSRILSGAGHPISTHAITSSKPEPSKGKFSYQDFCWFILANEDKSSSASIEYFFRILDTDSDGVISMFELHPFYVEQNERMIAWRVGDPYSFEDFICVAIDLIKPLDETRITARLQFLYFRSLI
jgi:serine/threonine-protein phosphatase 2A regulatory subunit B''